ncbi:MAG: extracellular solute-binding protein [Chloroflexi bacterium]|nr:extracellular solute-binding protein [Chloroflexota bacterium]
MKKRALFGILAALTAIGSLVACGPKTDLGPAAEIPALTGSRSIEVGGEPWEQQWQKVIAGAKREGKVVIYGTGGPTVREGLAPRLLEKYGIEMEFVVARAAQLAEKIDRERRAGLYYPDIYVGGSSLILTELKPLGLLDPLEPALLLPEVVNPGLWVNGQLNFLDRDRKALAFVAATNTPLAINTSLVKPGEIRSYKDLLQARWKGKILMNDPTIAGAGGQWYSGVGDKIMGFDYMRGLAKQEPVIIENMRLQVEWLAQGKYAVLLAPHDATLKEFKDAGAPVAGLIPEEGTFLKSGGGNIALINRPPHPNAARLFLNWLLTREGALLWQKAQGQQSARTDVPADFLTPLNVRQAGVNYASTDDEEFLLKRPQDLKEAREIFGPLMK